MKSLSMIDTHYHVLITYYITIKTDAEAAEVNMLLEELKCRGRMKLNTQLNTQEDF